MPSPTLILTPNWLRNDAVGNDVLGMVRALHRDGRPVSVHVPHACAPDYRDWLVDERAARAMLADPGTTMIYHHSIGCHKTQDLALGAECTVRVLRYHNVTPAHFLAPYDPEAARLCREGRDALVALVAHATHFLTPSRFNATELRHAGALPDAIVDQPCFHRLADFRYSRPDPDRSRALLADGRLRVLFVGRRSPHKGHRHLIRAVAAYARRFDREIVLHMVGGGDATSAGYDRDLRDVIDRAGLQAEVKIHDKLDFAELLAFYRHCDVFLCLSEHEGFCVPVIEAQSCGLPVIALAAGGVPEATGPGQPAGLPTPDPQDAALALRKIRNDPAGARRIGQAGAAWVGERFGHATIRRRFLQWHDSLAVNPAVAPPSTQAVAVDNVCDASDGSGFDPRWYGQRYPDVHRLGIAPQEHYEWLGKRLGRLPQAASANPDPA